MVRLFMLFSVLLVMIAAHSHGSVDGAADAVVRVDTIDIASFPEVSLGVTVTGADTKPLRGVKADAFEITQSGSPVTSVSVSEEQTGPVDVVIAIDTSGSMVPFIEESKAVALDLLGRLASQDRIGVTVFDERADPIISALTPDKNLIRDAIANLTAFRDRNTAFLSGLFQAVRLASEGSAAGRSVIVISDGEEEGNRSPTTEEEIKALAAGRGVQVYTIYVGVERPHRLFEDIANMTGGVRFDSSAGAAPRIGDHLNETLRSRLAVRFRSTSEPGIDPERISLSVKGSQPATHAFSLCQFEPQPVIWLPQVEPGRKLADKQRLEPLVICASGRPVQEIRFFIDGSHVDTDSAVPFNYQLFTDKMERGEHTVRVEATLVDGTRVVSPELGFLIAGNAFNPAYLLLTLALALAIVSVFLTAMRRRLRRSRARGAPDSAAIPAGAFSAMSSDLAVQEPSPEPPHAMTTGPAAPQAHLRVVSGPNEGQTYLITGNLVLGRAPDADVFLSGSSISREHARVWRDGGSYQVCDLGSTNGTKVNGRRVSQTVLSPGDKIEIAPYVLEFSN